MRSSGFHSNEELAAALADFPGAKIVRRLPHMKTVEVELPVARASFGADPGSPSHIARSSAARWRSRP
jgi:hypothetical protein